MPTNDSRTVVYLAVQALTGCRKYVAGRYGLPKEPVVEHQPLTAEQQAEWERKERERIDRESETWCYG